MGKRKFKEGDVVSFSASPSARTREIDLPPEGALARVEDYNSRELSVTWVDSLIEDEWSWRDFPSMWFTLVKPNYTPADYYQAITGE